MPYTLRRQHLGSIVAKILARAREPRNLSRITGMQRLGRMCGKFAAAWMFTVENADNMAIGGALYGSVAGGVNFMADEPPERAIVLMPFGMCLGSLCGACAGYGLAVWWPVVVLNGGIYCARRCIQP